jgi:hypothetical protein
MGWGRKTGRLSWRRGRGGGGPTRDIFFLNSFAGDYSSAITTLTKRETAEESGRVGKVGREGAKRGARAIRDCRPFYRFERAGILRRATLTKRQSTRGTRGAGGGRPFELLMREELSRLLSINFGNYVAEGVPPEENHPCPSRLLPPQSAPPFPPPPSPRAPTRRPFLLRSSLSLISFAR